MTIFEFVVLCFAVYRFSNLLSWESGPYDIFDKFRHFLGVRYNDVSHPYGTTMLSKAILCRWCNSVWISFAFMGLYLLIPQITILVLIPFAVSGVSCLISGRG